MPCFTSEYIDNNLNPKWRLQSMKAQTLGMTSEHSNVKIDVYDYDEHSANDLIGAFTSTLAELKAKITHGEKVSKTQMAEKFFPLRHPPTKAKYKRKNYKHSGLLEVVALKTIKCPSLLDYIQGGLEINLTVCIDYTGSNGRVDTPSSLHYMNPHALNQYQTAMLEVGAILQEYDTDKMLTAHGFGGSVDGVTTHCFPVTLNQSQHDVYGINGVHQAYVQSFQTGRVALSGPTYFAPMLKAMREKATNSMSQLHQKYHVMLILTDGAIMDMKHTVDEIVMLSRLPLSIIVIGVGPADFSSMEKLDGDVQPLRHSRASIGVCKRDIVQFVPFNKYKGRPADLASATLRELPGQVELYMRMNGLKPNAARAVVAGSMSVAAVAVEGAAHGAAAAAVAVQPGSFPAPHGQPAAHPYGQPAAAAAAVAQPYGQPAAQPHGHPPAGAVAQPYGQPAAQPYGQPPAGAVAQPYGQPAAAAPPSPAHLPAAQSAINVQVPAGVSPGQALHVQTPDGQMLQVVVPAGMTAGATFQVSYQPR